VHFKTHLGSPPQLKKKCDKFFSNFFLNSAIFPKKKQQKYSFHIYIFINCAKICAIYKNMAGVMDVFPHNKE
jgi:hypothetical protein